MDLAFSLPELFDQGKLRFCVTIFFVEPLHEKDDVIRNNE